MRAVLQLATPDTFVMPYGTATNVFYTYFVSRLGEEAIAAVSLVFPVTLLVSVAMTGGLGGGCRLGDRPARSAPGHRRHAIEVAEHAVAPRRRNRHVLRPRRRARRPAGLRAHGGHRERTTTLARRIRPASCSAAVSSRHTGAMLGQHPAGRGERPGAVRVVEVSLGLQIVLTPVFMFQARPRLIGADIAVIVSHSNRGGAAGALRVRRRSHPCGRGRGRGASVPSRCGEIPPRRRPGILVHTTQTTWVSSS
jgi:hypothetical protein